MLELIFAGLIFTVIKIKDQSEFVSNSEPDIHPSLRPRQYEFIPQPEPSRHAYRGPTAIRIKANRHNRKRNKP